MPKSRAWEFYNISWGALRNVNKPQRRSYMTCYVTALRAMSLLSVFFFVSICLPPKKMLYFQEKSSRLWKVQVTLQVTFCEFCLSSSLLRSQSVWLYWNIHFWLRFWRKLVPVLVSGSNSVSFCHMWTKLFQLCWILCDPVDCRPPISSVHGILQARILERITMSFSRGSSRPRDQTHISCISCIGRQILYH